ncbi:YadA-like family protein [[Pasteurella] aerogenes]
MNKIYMTKRRHDGKIAVCSELTRSRGKVKSIVTAVAAAVSMAVTSGSAYAAMVVGGAAGNAKVEIVNLVHYTGNPAKTMGVNGTTVTGSGKGMAVGENATVSFSHVNAGVMNNANALAIGNNAIANNTSKSVVIGSSALAQEINAVVIGNNATAIGTNNSVETRPQVAIGNNALIRNVNNNLQNNGAVTIGGNSLAGLLTPAGATLGAAVSLTDADYQTDSGELTAGRLMYRSGIIDASGATVANLNSSEATAIGVDSRAIGDQSIAIGAQVVAGHSSVAIGGNDMGTIAGDRTDDAVSVANRKTYKDITGADLASNQNGPWYETTYAKDGSVAIGQKAHSNELFGTAIGTSAFVEAGAQLGTAIGTGARVGAQTLATDANLTAKANFTTKGGVAIAAGAVAERDYTTAIGTGSKAIAVNATAIGYNALANGNNSTAVGAKAIASAADALAYGGNATSYATNAVAVGTNSTVVAGADSSIAFGTDTSVSGVKTVALGSNIKNVSTAGSVVLGDSSTGVTGAGAGAPHGVGTVPDAQVTSKNGAVITYGGFAGQPKDAGKYVSIGAVGAERQLKNVAAGNIASNSTDGINGSQLYAVAAELGNQVFQSTYFHVNNVSNKDTGNSTTNLGNITDAAGATGQYAVTAGVNATSNGTNGTAIGHGALSTGSAVVVGASASAIGVGSPYGANGAVAIGEKATVEAPEGSAPGSIAIGSEAHAKGVKISDLTTRTGEKIAVGTATVIGANAKAIDAGVAIGQAADAGLAQFATAVGVDARALGDRSTAMGVSTRATGQQAAAIGWNANASGVASLSIGTNSTSSGANSVAISGMSSASGAQSMALGYSANATGTNSIALGRQSGATGVQAAALTSFAKANGKDSIAAGVSATTTADALRGVAIARESSVSAVDGIAAGYQTKVSGTESIAIGAKSNVTGVQSIAVGVGHVVEANNAGAFGDPNYIRAGADRSYIYGNNNTVTTADTFVLGSNVNRNADGTDNALGTVKNSVYLGNGTEVTAGGAVGTAVLDTNQVAGTTTTAGDTGEVLNATVGGVTYDGFAGAMANGAVSVGAAGAERRVQNVAAGEISKTSTDAINGSQLYLVTQGTLDQFPVIYTDADGNKLVKAPDGNFYPADSVVIDGKYYPPGTTPEQVADGSVTALNPVDAGDVIASMNDGDNKADAPKTLANVQGNLDPTYNKGDMIIGADGKPTTNPQTTYTTNATGPTAEEAAKMYNNAATVGDILNAGWNLKENGGDRDFVKPYDTVNFVNGEGTTANVTISADGKTSNVTYNVNVDGKTTQLTYVTTGTDGKPVTVYKQPDGSYNTAKDGSGDKVTTPVTSQITAVSTPAQVNGENVTGPVNLVDGDTTTVTETPDGIKVEVKTGDITAEDNGTVTGPVTSDMTDALKAAEDALKNLPADATPDQKAAAEQAVKDAQNVINNAGNQVATAQNVADAINGSGWNAAVDKTGTGESEDKGGDALVNPGDTVTMIAGDNIKITKDGLKYTVETKKDVNFNSTSIGGTTVTNPDGSTTVNNPITIGTTPEGNNVIANITGNLAPTYNKGDMVIGDDGKPTTTAQTTPTKSQTGPTPADAADMYNNAATVGDILNAGWNLKENGGDRDFVKPYDTVNFVNGEGTTANVTVSADGKTSNVTYNVNVDGKTTQLTYVTTGADGKPVTVYKQPDGSYNTAKDGSGDKVTTPVTSQITAVSTPAQVNGENVTGPVNIVNGNTTTVTETPDGIKVEVKTGDITAEDNGTVTGPVTSDMTDALKAAEDALKNLPADATPDQKAAAEQAVKDAQNVINNAGNQVATAQNVADAINGSGWRTNSTTATGGANETVVNPGEIVNFEAGKNMTVTQTVTKDAAGKDVISYTYATKDDVNFNSTSIGGTTVTNPDGSTTVNNPITIGTTPEGNNVIANLTSTLPNTTSVPTTDANGKPVPVTTEAPISAQDAQDIANKSGSNAATLGDVLNSGWNLQNNGAAKDFVKPYDTVNFVDGQGTKAVVESDGATSTVKVDIDTGTLTANNDGTINGVVPPAKAAELTQALKDAEMTLAGLPANAPEAVKNAAKAAVFDAQNAINDAGLNKVATVQNVAEAINNSGFTLTTSKSKGGEVYGTSKTLINPGKTVTLDAGKNISIIQDAGKVSIATSMNPTFTSVQVGGDNGPKIGADGDNIKVSKADGSPTKITNVARGVDKNDAVNVGQLKDEIGGVHNRINKVDKDLRAGIAGSNAAATLPQVYIPGKSMVAAAAGTFKGENAFAVGYSRASDNGKLILKLQGNANSQGDIGGGVGIGYQW